MTNIIKFITVALLLLGGFILKNGHPPFLSSIDIPHSLPVGFLLVLSSAILVWKFSTRIDAIIFSILAAMALFFVWTRYPIFTYVIIGLIFCLYCYWASEGKCPKCGGKWPWITIDQDNLRVKDGRQSNIREDINLNHKGEFIGSTKRVEQVDVRIFNWEVIKKCKYCGHLENIEKKEEALPL